MAVKVTVTNHFNEVAEQLPVLASQIVRATGLAVLKDAQENIKRNHQIRTGHMLASGHIEPIDRFNLYVIFGAEYSAYQELGTRYMAARPYLTPAIDHERGPFEHAFSALGKLHTIGGPL